MNEMPARIETGGRVIRPLSRLWDRAFLFVGWALIALGSMGMAARMATGGDWGESLLCIYIGGGQLAYLSARRDCDALMLAVGRWSRNRQSREDVT